VGALDGIAGDFLSDISSIETISTVNPPPPLVLSLSLSPFVASVPLHMFSSSLFPFFPSLRLHSLDPFASFLFPDNEFASSRDNVAMFVHPLKLIRHPLIIPQYSFDEIEAEMPTTSVSSKSWEKETKGNWGALGPIW
jgi:hypothetical protein